MCFVSRLFAWFLPPLGALAVGSCGPAAPPAAPPAPFVLEEATITGIHAAFASGTLTCRQLVTNYLARIEAYDDDGPALSAIITVTPGALEIAADMDARHALSPSAVGPLHCVPVVLKDNYDTADLPTTGGSVTLAESVPIDDAFVVQRLRTSGALVLAKANLTELARGGTTLSSLTGQTKNPYDLTRTPGGSSGGTAAAIGLMETLGATMVRMSIPGLDELTRGLGVSSFEAKVAFNAYLADLGSRAPVRTLEEFLGRGGFHDSIRRGLETDQQVADGLNDPEYHRRLRRRQNLRQAVMTVMAYHNLDAFLYPHLRRLVAPIGEPQLERNGAPSNRTGFPAITVPGGFSMPSVSAPLGVPIGIELLGEEWSEPRLTDRPASACRCLCYANADSNRTRRRLHARSA